YNRDMEAVHEMEAKLGVNSTWTTESPEYKAAVKAVKEKKFNDALNKLKLLIVERIFELTKINSNGPPVMSLEPPALELSWEEVVEYAFLADFDFL
ncbi:hypothetical protein B0H17DRAFT_901797, partial [Mycena rosella]